MPLPRTPTMKMKANTEGTMIQSGLDMPEADMLWLMLLVRFGREVLEFGSSRKVDNDRLSIMTFNFIHSFAD